MFLPYHMYFCLYVALELAIEIVDILICPNGIVRNVCTYVMMLLITYVHIFDLMYVHI